MRFIQWTFPFTGLIKLIIKHVFVECDLTQFACPTHCIPLEFVCDGDVDCPGEADEQYCQSDGQ